MKNKLIAAIVAAVMLLPGISLAQTSIGVSASSGTAAYNKAVTVGILEAELATLIAKVQTLETQMMALSSSTVNWTPSSTVSWTTSSTTSSTINWTSSSTFTPSSSVPWTGPVGSSTSSSWCYAFNLNLGRGSTGPAVSALQAALGKNGEEVSANGSFDAQTEAAVKNFQAKYGNSVLAPNGLSAGTGFVGSSTRQQLNRLFSCGNPMPIVPPPHHPSSTPTSTPIWNPSSTPSSTGPITVPPPIIPPFHPTSTPVVTPTSTASSSGSLSPSSGPVGTSVTIHGNGFSASNLVELDGLTASPLHGLASSDGQTLTFTVPGSLAPNCNLNEACPQFMLLVTPHAYLVTVISSGTTQSFGQFTVIASSSTWNGPIPVNAPMIPAPSNTSASR